MEHVDMCVITKFCYINDIKKSVGAFQTLPRVTSANVPHQLFCILMTCVVLILAVPRVV